MRRAAAALSLDRGTPRIRGTITRTRDQKDVRSVGKRERLGPAAREPPPLVQECRALVVRQGGDEGGRGAALDQSGERQAVVVAERPLLDRTEERGCLDRRPPLLL